MKFTAKTEFAAAAEAYHAAKRNEALKTMRDEIAQTLTEVLKVASETGDSKIYRDKWLTIPEYFQDAKGAFDVPEEIRDELKEAGYGINCIHNNQYRLW